jgi:hypothetical protein
MARLDGTWSVERVGGLLPPMPGVRKTIRGARGETRVGPLPVRFDVHGLELRYRPPFSAFVDILEPDGDGAADAFSGTATFAGRHFGRFRMRRVG